MMNILKVSGKAWGRIPESGANNKLTGLFIRNLYKLVNLSRPEGEWMEKTGEKDKLRDVPDRSSSKWNSSNSRKGIYKMLLNSISATR
jgi:hypothetical protein